MSFLHVNHLTEVTERRPTFVALGSFDGVHRGHQEVIGSMVRAARVHGARAAVLTFFPHPKRVIQNLTGPYYITRLEDRVALLAEMGVDLVITHPFDDEVRTTRAAAFVDQLLHYLDMRQIWGGNFAFGYKREGDVPFLRALGAEKGFTVELVKSMVQVGDDWVSSSRIRRCLQAGNVTEVNLCLGRPYHVTGTIIMGDQRGRTIGFPTANLDAWVEQLLPANGVYATYAWLDDTRYVAATNVGVRPTVNGREPRVEAHLLDFDDDIYGQELRVEFVERIRAEQKFPGLDALKQQIAADVAYVRQTLT
ncbi:MAG: bifunctional riboflavin kinase/FAD synthetase [Ardenticatenaceae bacterium]|nr:bifunctional riboflavin kinase/FAD synthetase [Anaerolineales bacterium]MCB8922645.1 bifunctional riboflavin kinase/FAD synthetase [Ardenticatenaceae bacterium]MCB9003647.1 bifunctional riboflavin kinase/FAD synthetase [Ardenticatenaceae bacterium]